MSETKTPSERMRLAAKELRDASPNDGWALRLIADGLDNDADEWDAGRLPDDLTEAALELADSFEVPA